MLQTVSKPDGFERGFGTVGTVTQTDITRVQHGQLNLALRRSSLKQIETLEYKAYLLVTHLGKLLVIQLCDVYAVEIIFAAGGLVERPQDLQHGAFATTGWPHDADEFTLVNAQGNPVQGRNLNLAHLIDFGDVPNVNDGLAPPFVGGGHVIRCLLWFHRLLPFTVQCESV